MEIETSLQQSGRRRNQLSRGIALHEMDDRGGFFAARRLVQRVPQFREHMLGGHELAAWQVRFADGSGVRGITTVKRRKAMEGVRESARLIHFL